LWRRISRWHSLAVLQGYFPSRPIPPKAEIEGTQSNLRNRPVKLRQRQSRASIEFSQFKLNSPPSTAPMPLPDKPLPTGTPIT
jgi:hypothetical protein